MGGAQFLYNQLFSYKTTPRVKLRDEWLGVIYNTLLLLGLGYNIGYNVIVGRAYLEVHIPASMSRLTIKEAPESRIRHLVESGQLTYCADNASDTIYGRRYPCAFIDGHDMVYPHTNVGSLAISTRISYRSYNYTGCNDTDWRCQPTQGPKSTLFLGAVEDSTLFIDHNIRHPEDVRTSRSIRTMRGELLDCNGAIVKPFPLKDPEMTDAEDIVTNRIIPLRTLLAATGVRSVDDKLTCGSGDLLEATAEAPSTRRYDGGVLLVSIFYDNTLTFNLGNFHYTVRSFLVPETEYKIEVLRPDPLGTGIRVLENRHGLLVVVVQTGKMGRFSFLELLIVVTSSLTLMKAASSFTDLVALYFMPKREQYHSYMVTVSDQLGHVRRKRKRLPTPPLQEPLLGVVDEQPPEEAQHSADTL